MITSNLNSSLVCFGSLERAMRPHGKHRQAEVDHPQKESLNQSIINEVKLTTVISYHKFDIIFLSFSLDYWKTYSVLGTVSYNGYHRREENRMAQHKIEYDRIDYHRRY